MVRDFNDWIKQITETDNLCANYYKKVQNAKSSKQLMDIVMDSNGMSFLPEMEAHGVALPYEVITSRFGSFINGNYIGEFKNDKGNGYTSAIYCCYQGTINADTTLLTVLGCKANIYVAENNVVTIYADKNCELNIGCPANARCTVHYWGEEPEISGNVELIKEE